MLSVHTEKRQDLLEAVFSKKDFFLKKARFKKKGSEFIFYGEDEIMEIN